MVRVGGCTGRSEQRRTSRVQPGASVSPAPSTSPSFPLPSPSLPESPSPPPHSRHVLDEAEDGHEVPISHSPADERLHRDHRCRGKGGRRGEKEISEAWRRTSRGKMQQTENKKNEKTGSNRRAEQECGEGSGWPTEGGQMDKGGKRRGESANGRAGSASKQEGLALFWRSSRGSTCMPRVHSMAGSM